MIKVHISDEVLQLCPDLQVLTIECDVVNTPSDEKLWKDIAVVEAEFRQKFKIEDINKRIPIQATRQAYKKMGKDPNRYRPSAESLCRRIIRGLPLYKIDTLVDIVNLISIESGFSIGAFDVSKIQGDELVLGIGVEGELYNGIGKGLLNIAGLPVYRDKQGGIGTPTSDEERTKIEMNTTKLLMIINGYSGNDHLIENAQKTVYLLKQYISGNNFHISLINKEEVCEIKL